MGAEISSLYTLGITDFQKHIGAIINILHLLQHWYGGRGVRGGGVKKW